MVVAEGGGTVSRVGGGWEKQGERRASEREARGIWQRCEPPCGPSWKSRTREPHSTAPSKGASRARPRMKW